ncbi:hypothetical protein H6G94_34055 [Nostoc punctiforme FACHB-252]|uniref:VWA containing CoxE family protein n=1 Tax=Nostoc punctiforme FACHB-252 TaxID=1357509 RepID=A0ABR8HM43_NOSPU|nr:hypothetical protein [Nostoc punctiforme]MBD2616212.1 hypothetical protein [Nostoc punctiforme FACHB-252]
MSKVITEQNQNYQIEELLLLDLFMELRKAGLRLGIDEYKLLQKALQAGFGTDRDSLKRLCQAIWVKSSEEQRLYNSLFEKLVLSLETQNPTSIVDKQSSSRTKSQTPRTKSESKSQAATESVDNKSQQIPSPLNDTTPEPIDKEPDKPSPSTPNPDDPLSQATSERNEAESSNTYYNTNSIDNTELIWSPFDLESTLQIENLEDEKQVAKSLLMESFILTGEYFPVTGRQMKQSWRFLKRPVREGLPVELDLEATVKQIGYKGILLELVLVPLRVNRAELFLLLDQDGSMVPFHLLSRRLAETLLRGGRLGKAGIYYFQNCPIEYLYRDCYRQEAELTEKFLRPLRTERSSVLIFSDAGAARGGYSTERVKLTKKFLDKLKRKVRYVAWLNPMPKDSWKGTTAQEINKIVPMFEFSRRGLQDAIGVLRGRPTNFEGRTI